HGYLRVRAELLDTFWLGRAPNDFLYDSERSRYQSLRKDGLGPDPFSLFRPLERSRGNIPCAGEDITTDAGLGGAPVCDIDTLQGGNVRFRLSPQLNISEDVRVKATFDVVDNFVLGNGHYSYYGSGAAGDPIFTGTDLPTGQTIVARRAWAEVRNRDLGELRFGIMPEHWGLGMVYNSGNKLDDDYSTDWGRVMAVTKIAGFYLSASYDFIADGVTTDTLGVFRPGYDHSQLDDVDQWSFSVVRQVPDEDEHAVLERGDMLLNGGIHFQLKNQTERYVPAMAAMGAMPATMETLEPLNAELYTPDIWGQLRYQGLRLEIEGAGVFGSLRHNGEKYDVIEWGLAFESELRLIDNKLGIYFYSGLATGDSDVEGLSALTDYVDQLNENDGKITTFRFHPSYRVDQILWRNIMRQVTGAYYFKPGISYDFVKDDFGQLFGARLDVIWSRAMNFLQTPGNNSNLGVELNAQLYWRSDDGPDIDDGYHAILEYSVLFPMDGLGYYHRATDLDTAQCLRLILGVVY
ncbi:MAG TPA: TIGR04551 family protein, partial [Polyangiales bacterium]|nr:TIGR04551 family protein [Polyangiales bacterium]